MHNGGLGENFTRQTLLPIGVLRAQTLKEYSKQRSVPTLLDTFALMTFHFSVRN